MIYMDHAATTPVRKEVVAAMAPFWTDIFGNPGSLHSKGLEAHEALDSARDRVAAVIGANAMEIIFTGGGTESCNLAIKGFARANKTKGRHIVTQLTEHHAVLDSCIALEKEGFDITYLPVDRHGLVSPERLKAAIRQDTILVTIMYANNEIGTVQPIAELSRIAHERGVAFHTDACQAGGQLDVNVQRLGADMMTLNGSKIYGPKGVGMLYLKRGIKLEPVIHGGGQEGGLRSGTENVPGIIGFAKALELAQAERDVESKRLTGLRDRLIEGIIERVPKSFLNGHPTQRLSNNVNVSILDIEGEAMILHLNDAGICASTGSACTSRSLEPSHVIRAIGLPYEAAHGSLRFTLGKENTQADVDRILEVLPPIVTKLRELSPVRLSMESVLAARRK
jgi:cysteine desulfurase